ncbi:MAG: prephenate dehydrogenase [Spirochaetales bacterium]|nr:prephenate dehydrogenase [Spirochaetales bacterium]
MDCGIIGFGNFSRVMAEILRDFFPLYCYDTKTTYEVPEYVRRTSLEDTASKDIVLLSIPVQYLDAFWAENAALLNKNLQGKIFDVCSVKVKTLQLAKKYLNPEIYYMGLHPLFGPMSTKGCGAKGQNIVVCPPEKARPFDNEVIRFLSENLCLNVVKMTAEEHDKEMALVQGISHFIAHGLADLAPHVSNVATKGYNKMLEMYQMFSHDSQDLFVTLENENPFAKPLRRKFIDTLLRIEKELEEFET